MHPSDSRFGFVQPHSSHALKRDPLSKLVFELSKLPGIGEKTATRLAYFILKEDPAYAIALSSALLEAKQKTHLCKNCHHLADSELCFICKDPARNQELLCIVEKPSDVTSIENGGSYRGLYHVLHGVLSPLNGIGPEELKISELLARIGKTSIHEAIFATNPSVEGDATALYLSRLIKPFVKKVTKLAHGLPAGGQLEYSDRQTISKALENRLELTP